MNRRLALALPVVLILGCGDDDGGGGGGRDAGSGEIDAGGGGDDAGGGGTDASGGDPDAAVGAGPSAEITFPTDGATTAEDVEIAFTVGAGTARVECTVDSAPVACAPDTLMQVLTGGDHTVTVQAFDADDNGGPVDSVTWSVDAAPPVITGLTTTALGPGSVRVDFTVVDQSAIDRLRCGLDGAPRVNCGSGGSGSITYSELSPGQHTVDIFAIDEWGHSGASVIAAPVPSSHAVATFQSVSGAGHLVVIGDDYADPFGPVSQMDRVLYNAFAQSPAISYGRQLRLGLVSEGASPEEIDHIISFLDISVGPAIDTVDLDDLPARVGDVDVLLITDQNGLFDDGTASFIAFTIEPSLRNFLDAGGVVILLDGTFDGGGGETESDSFRLLFPTLLDLRVAEQYDGCAYVPCNTGDPLLVDSQPPVCLTGAVGFDTAEPWVTFSYAGGALDLPIVLHRWFGTAAAGPVALRSGDGTQVWAGSDAIFQDAAGAEVATCTTIGNGSAVHQMGSGGSVSLGRSSGPDTELITAIDVQPLDSVALRLATVTEPPPQLDITVDLPFLVTAASYRLMAGCDQSVLSEVPDAIALTVRCFNPDGTFNLIGEARDASDDLVGFIMLTGVNDPQGSTIVMGGPWQTPNLIPNVTLGALPDVDLVDMSVLLGVDGIDFLERDQSIDPTVDPPVFYSSPGPPGSDPFDRLTHIETVRFSSEVATLGVFSSQRVSGPLVTSLSIALDLALLPRITDAALFFDGSERLNAVWVLAGPPTGADGAALTIGWNDGAFHSWTLIVPPVSQLIAPPAPASAAAAYWPTSSSGAFLRGLRIDDASFTPTYRDYLGRFADVLAPPVSQLTLRTTELR